MVSCDRIQDSDVLMIYVPDETKYHHETEGHEMGLHYTLNHVREKYVVVHGRETVKKVIKNVLQCRRRLRGKAAAQQMATLPTIR